MESFKVRPLEMPDNIWRPWRESGVAIAFIYCLKAMVKEERVRMLDTIIEMLEIRYQYDANGRITGGFENRANPHFVFGRSDEGCVWRFGEHVAIDVVNAVARLAGREMGARLEGQGSPPPERLVMIERLVAGTGDEVKAYHEFLTVDGVAVAELWTMT